MSTRSGIRCSTHGCSVNRTPRLLGLMCSVLDFNRLRTEFEATSRRWLAILPSFFDDSKLIELHGCALSSGTASSGRLGRSSTCSQGFWGALPEISRQTSMVTANTVLKMQDDLSCGRWLVSAAPWKNVRLSASPASVTLISDASWSQATSCKISWLAIHPTRPPGSRVVNLPDRSAQKCVSKKAQIAVVVVCGPELAIAIHPDSITALTRWSTAVHCGSFDVRLSSHLSVVRVVCQRK